MFNPQHVKNGELVEAAIPLEELRSKGFSVHRMEYVTGESVKESIRERLSRPRTGAPWRDEGVARLQASAVRALRVNDQQAFVVIDTATEDNQGHASIYAAAPERGRAHAKELRALLLPLLQERMSLQQAFDSIAR
jgi:hypothetical protein